MVLVDSLVKPRVVLTHGEDIARKALSNRIRQRFGLASELPAQGNVVEISGAEHALARTA